MLTKADFQQAIRDSIAQFPAVAPLYQAGDPRVHQQVDAMATMLAMFSAQIEVAQAEPFEKARDATVLADAAMRGIVRKGTPSRVRIKATNKGATAYSLASGRTLLDSSGRSYRVETAVSVPAGGSAIFDATQVRYVTVPHTVSGSLPFYAVEVPPPDDEGYLASIAVSDSGGEYAYRDRYVNTAPGERVFHVEADDRQRVFVRFGYEAIVGVQPRNGAALTLTVGYTSGNIQIAAGTPFAFEYLNSPAESNIELKLDSVSIAGQNPIPMSVLRDLARYPSVYDHNAVYLGEFDFLVRRNFPTLRFLSVWNESAEEAARGADVGNINVIFVACLSEAGGEQVLTATDPAAIPEPVRIPVAITASVPTSFVSAVVRQKIAEAILAEYGEQSMAARRGRNQPLYQSIYALLRRKVAALGVGSADLQVAIEAAPGATNRPELWRYVSAESLTVTVETANIVAPAWGP